MYSLLCQLEEMKAANQVRISEGFALAYSEDDFAGLSSEFEMLSVAIANCN